MADFGISDIVKASVSREEREKNQPLDRILFYANLDRKMNDGFQSARAQEALDAIDEQHADRFKNMYALDYMAEGTAAGVAALRQSYGGLLQFTGMNGGEDIAREATEVQNYLNQGYEVSDPEENKYESPSWWGRAARSVAAAGTAAAPLMAAGAAALPAAGAAVAGATGATGALTGGAATAATAGAYGVTALLGSLQTLGSTYDSWLQKTGSEEEATDKALQAAVASGAINVTGGLVMARILGNDGFRNLINGVASDQVLRESIKKLGQGVGAQGVTGLVDNTTQNLINELPAGTGALEATLLSMIMDPGNASIGGRLGVEFIRNKAARQTLQTYIPTIDNRFTKALASINARAADNADIHSTTDLAKKLIDDLFQLEKFKDAEAVKNDPIAATDRVFEEAVGSDLTDLKADTARRHYEGFDPRIMPAESDPETPMPTIRDMQKKFTEALGVNVFNVMPSSGDTLGYLNTLDAGVRVQRGSLDTLAHEIGHRLDFEYDINDIKTGAFDDELLPLSVYGSRPPEGVPPDIALTYMRGEGAAEGIRAYIINPEAARAKAPNFVEALELKIPEAKLQAMQAYGKDVRRFFHSTALERGGAQIVSAVVPKKPILERTMDFVNQDSRVMSWKDKLLTNWSDGSHLAQKGFGILKKASGRNYEGIPSEDPQVLLTRYIALPKSNAPEVIENGYRNIAGDLVTDNFTTIFQDIDKANFRDDLRDAMAYMVAKSTKERVGRDFIEKMKDVPDREAAAFAYAKSLTRRPLTGSGSDYFSDFDDAIKILESVKPEDAARYDRTHNYIKKFYSALTQELVDAGVISKKPDMDEYAPIRRVLETEPGEADFISGMTGELRLKSGTLKKMGKPGFLKEWKGSTAPIRNIAEQMLEDADRTRRTVAQAMLINSIEKLYPKTPGVRGTSHFGDAAMSQYFVKLSKEDKVPEGASGRVWNLGKNRKYLLSKDFADAISVLDDSSVASPFLNLWTSTMRVLRNSIVYTPIFASRNSFKDTFSRLISSDIASIGDYAPSEIKQGWKESVSRLKSAGVNSAGLYKTDPATYGAYVEAVVKDMERQGNVVIPLSEKIAEKFKSLKDVYVGAIEKSEMVNRVAEYKAAKRDFRKKFPKGSAVNEELYAAHRALELMNFTRAGRMVVQINKMVPFTNAAIRAMARTVDVVKSNPKSVLMKATLGVGAMKALAYGAAIAGGYLDEYQDLPWYQRDMGFSFKLGSRNWLWIPGPYEYAIIGSGLERAFDYVTGNEKAFEGFDKSVVSSLLPLDESMLVGPQRAIVENMANYDFFKKRPIVPTHETALDVDARLGTENASSIGKFFQAIFGIDPRYADHLVTGLGGNVGKMATTAADTVFGDDVRQAKAIRNVFGSLTGLGFEPSVYSSPDVQWLFDNAGRLGVSGKKEFKSFANTLRDASRAESEEEFIRLNDRAKAAAERLRKKYEASEDFLKEKMVRKTEAKRRG